MTECQPGPTKAPASSVDLAALLLTFPPIFAAVCTGAHTAVAFDLSGVLWFFCAGEVLSYLSGVSSQVTFVLWRMRRQRGDAEVKSEIRTTRLAVHFVY